MQEKRTLYLAGKITGDPYYFTKFYNAQKKLEEGGFIVVNPALLPAEGFTWEAYMRMSGANLEALCQDCHNKEHHRNDKKKRYAFDEAGNLISPPIRSKFREGSTPRAGD